MSKSNLHKYYIEAIRTRGFPHQSSGKFRSSEGTATIVTPYGTKVVGACKRKIFYRLSKTPPSSPEALDHQIQRMKNGKAIEERAIEDLKQMGLYAGDAIRRDFCFDGVEIAGELDIVLRTSPCSPSRYCTEVKTIYNYMANKSVLGRGRGFGPDVGAPRESYLMQLGLYLRHFSKLSVDNPSYLPFGALLIIDRGDGYVGTYDVWLREETQVLPEGGTTSRHKIIYASEDLKVPETAAAFTIEDILAGFRAVTKALEAHTPPPRDFIREYDRETIELLYSHGEIGKTAYNKWISSHGPRGKGKEKLGDWHCFSMDTEILTASGWKLGCNVEEGEIIATFNRDTERIEFKPVLKAFAKKFNGNLIEVYSDRGSLLVTPEHRFLGRLSNRPRWEVFTAEHLIDGTSLPRVGETLQFMGSTEQIKTRLGPAVNEDVWCVHVANETLVVRRKGLPKITMNCNPLYCQWSDLCWKDKR